MPTTSLDEYGLVTKLRHAGVLQSLECDKLPRGGWAKCCCPDGDRSPELFRFFGDIAKAANRRTVCCHPCIMLGGPAAVPAHSPIHAIDLHTGPTTADTLIRWQLDGALAVGKDIQNIALIPHYPCGMMQLYGITLLDNLRLTFEAKDLIREWHPQRFRHVKVMFHVETPSGAFKTYLVVREKFEQFLAASHQRQDVTYT